jgi:hypothetical protein
MAEFLAGSFLLGGFPVTRLEDQYYSRNNITCNICRTDAEADVDPPTFEQDPDHDLRSIPQTSVIRTSACGHKFHELCLVSWLHSQLLQDQHGTCPKCRGLLISNRHATNVNTEPGVLPLVHELSALALAQRLQVAMQEVRQHIEETHRQLDARVSRAQQARNVVHEVRQQIEENSCELDARAMRLREEVEERMRDRRSRQ